MVLEKTWQSKGHLKIITAQGSNIILEKKIILSEQTGVTKLQSKPAGSMEFLEYLENWTSS